MIDAAGDYVFLGHLTGGQESGVPFTAGPGDGRTVEIWSLATGDHVHNLMPSEVVGRNSNWIDHAFGVRATRRSNGEYVIFVEDVVLHKTLIYRGMLDFSSTGPGGK